MPAANQILMEFNSNLKFTEFSIIVLNFLKNILNIEENDSFEIEISLREAVNNAIIHGNNSRIDKRVYLLFHWEKRYLRIEVTDENEDKFSVENLEKKDDEKSLLAYSGRGILLMKNYMDSVKFENCSPGTRVILEKSI